MRSPLVLCCFSAIIFVYAGCHSARPVDVAPDQASASPAVNPPAGQNDPQSGQDVTVADENPLTAEEGILFSGTFSVNMTGYRGKLTLSVKNGHAEGMILFPDWGHGEPQTLHDVHVNIKERKIYFIRSVTTEEEMKRTGSSRLFTQVYRGVFSPDWKKIRGVYTDAGADYSWQAER